MPLDLSDPIYNDEDAARAYLEGQRWPDGPYCPHCGEAERVTRLQGRTTRPGLFACRACRQQFSVTVGTLYERSHVPLHKWVLATHLLACSKKGVSAHQLHRMLGVTYKTAWFMAHRIRAGMAGKPAEAGGLGGEGKIVEADETYIGRKAGWRRHRGGGAHKMKVLSLVERGGPVRSVRMEAITSSDVAEVLRRNVSRKSRLMTDEANYYKQVGTEFARHEAVNHSAGEYVRGEAHTNTLEGYFSVFKRGMKGVYQHCGEQHLHRYLAEFDFRYNNRVALGVDDWRRAELAIRGIEGKRLTYRRPDAARHP
jgi:transposase-like protein